MSETKKSKRKSSKKASAKKAQAKLVETTSALKEEIVKSTPIVEKIEVVEVPSEKKADPTPEPKVEVAEVKPEPKVEPATRPTTKPVRKNPTAQSMTIQDAAQRFIKNWRPHHLPGLTAHCKTQNVVDGSDVVVIKAAFKLFGAKLKD